MQDFITVKIFTLPQDAYGAKALLEAEGIRCFLGGEFTVQVYNFLSNASGGVKLNVWHEDVEEAITLLTDAGYLKPPEEEKPSKLLADLENFTARIPLLNQAPFLIRLAVLIAITVTAIILFTLSFQA